METIRIQRALLSVSDKTGLEDLGRTLHAAGVRMYSTGGTRQFLERLGLPVEDVAGYTGFPEMMDGRLKTLHPKIFGGILGRPDRADDRASQEQHGIAPFELVVVNLYPFAQTIARPGVTTAEAVEQVDIGGPSLVRAAGKNHAFVAVATSPHQYTPLQEEITRLGGTTRALRNRLAAEAFAHTAEYDRVIAAWFAREIASPKSGSAAADAAPPSAFPREVSCQLTHDTDLRYGENPHQRAAVYRLQGEPASGVIGARKLHGKELSYNNLLDLDSAVTIARALPDAAAVVIKHNNPCGAASASRLREAVEQAMLGDPVSAFGSVIGLNQPVDEATAEYLATPGLFVEAIAAPAFSPAAVTVLTTKPKWKNNVRLLELGESVQRSRRPQMRMLEGGALLQDADDQPDPEAEWKVVTGATPADSWWGSLRLAWEVVRHVKSNAIVVAQGLAVCGVGAGQMSRVDSVEIALSKSGARARGGVLASDAFFPFPDSIHKAAAAGISAIIQPGGSVKDAEVIAACNEHGITMIFTGRRHFKH